MKRQVRRFLIVGLTGATMASGAGAAAFAVGSGSNGPATVRTADVRNEPEIRREPEARGRNAEDAIDANHNEGHAIEAGDQGTHEAEPGDDNDANEGPNRGPGEQGQGGHDGGRGHDGGGDRSGR